MELFTFMWIVILIIYFVSSRLSLLFFFFASFSQEWDVKGVITCHAMGFHIYIARLGLVF